MHQIGANTFIEINTGEPITEDSRVEFRLIYQGEIFSASRNDPRAGHKHNVRRALHPQLRRLWEVNGNLKDYARVKGLHSPRNTGSGSDLLSEELPQWGMNAIADEWTRGNYKFLPLVTSDLALRCRLDIILLRPSEGRFIFTQGDIDGQLKTLFDALKIPESLAGTDAPEQPIADEMPLFCLLQDDRLISEVQVVADQLLLLPGQRAAKATDCFAVIHVTLNHRNARTYDNWFG